MATVNQEYIKNKDGEIISPITSTESLRNPNGDVPPQIVAWANISVNTSYAITINGSYNIKSIIRKQNGGSEAASSAYYYEVLFTKPIKDANYAVSISLDVSGTKGEEIVGVYSYSSGGFRIDCYTGKDGSAVGNEHVPVCLSFIVVR